MLAYIGVIVALGPMLAPVLGGWMLTICPWNWIFVVQAAMGAIALAGMWRKQETLVPELRTDRLGLLVNYGRLFGNPAYLGTVFLVAFSVVPLFAFIGASSDIYMTRFGLSSQVFGYFFGFNALALMMGALFFTRIHRFFSSGTILAAGFLLIAAGGAWMLAIPRQGPWNLALPMLLISFSCGMSRPPGNNLVLEQVRRNAGAASSLLMFFIMTGGATSMWVISLGWADKIEVLGWMGVICGGSTFACWQALKFMIVIGVGPRHLTSN